MKSYVAYGIIGTLAYDAVTGLGIGTLLFHQPFMQALIGQIPFTAWHLFGTISFSVLVSPFLYRWVVANGALEWPVVKRKLALLFARW